MKTEMLRLKQINPLGKLILQLIFDEPKITYQWNKGYDCTAYDMAKILGTTRKKILDELWVLEELGFIKTTVLPSKQRITRITPRLKRAMKVDCDNKTLLTTVPSDKQLLAK